MKKQLEAKLTKNCKDFFEEIKRKHKGFYFHKVSDRFTSGIPDYYVAYKGSSAWIELKKPGEVADPIQEYTMRRLKQAGIPCLCTDDFRKVECFINGVIIDGVILRLF